MSTCTVTPIQNLPAVVLWWASEINNEDILPAFRNLNTIITASPVPIYVLVDLRQQPHFPLTDTLRGALEGPFRNPRLVEWLVIGSTPLAQTIGRTLSAITLRRNIRCFETEADAKAYLYRQLSERA